MSFFISILCFICLSNNIDLSHTFLIRIKNILDLGTKISLESIVEVEASLGTRIVCNYNQFCLFLKHPIAGVGFMNTGYMLIEQFRNSPITLTYEMQLCLIEATNKIAFTSNAMYSLLYQTGIVGFLIYVILMVKSIKILDNVMLYFN